jgi:O-methyltransferase
MIALVGMETINAFIDIAQKTPNGAFVEVGVYQGGSGCCIAAIGELQGRKVYLYDTFTGIPYKDEIDVHQVGDFSDTSYEFIKESIPYATVTKGIFPESAIEMGDIAFVHLDCDQYRSIVESVEYLKPKMVKGGIMWFDDYGCLAGATKAVHDLFGDNIEIVANKAMVRF